MNEMTCEEVRERAAELALDALPGDQRAAVLAHLDSCAACRAVVDDLSLAADRLLLALPEADVPPALSERLHRNVAPSEPAAPAAPAAPSMPAARASRRGRASWRWAIAAAVLAVVVAAGAIAFLGDGNGAPGGVGQFSLMTPAGVPVGVVGIDGTDEPWIHVSIDGGDGTAQLTCRLQLDDGSWTDIGALQMDDGTGYWGAPLELQPDQIRAADVVRPDGTTVATAVID